MENLLASRPYGRNSEHTGERFVGGRRSVTAGECPLTQDASNIFKGLQTLVPREIRTFTTRAPQETLLAMRCDRGVHGA